MRGIKKLRRSNKNSVVKIRPPKEAVDLVAHYEAAKSLRQSLVQNVVPFASGTIFIFVVAKVLLISGGNVNTAVAVVQSAGTVQVVAGAVLLSFPFLITGIANTIGIWANDKNRFNLYIRRRLWYAYILFTVILAGVVSAFYIVLLITYGLLYFVGWAQSRRKISQDDPRARPPVPPAVSSVDVKDLVKGAAPQDVELRRCWLRLADLIKSAESDDSALKDLPTAIEDYNRRAELLRQYQPRTGMDSAVILAILLSTLLPLAINSFNDKVWLPSEAIRVGASTEVGYVLSITPAWTTILDEKSRLITVVKTSEVANRTPCALPSRTSPETIFNWFGAKRQDYPTCPK